jgi:D-beta-D-heptose 7-phosphate kinase/D-beta-D-heptose 1-phosphate adenosyltransferase
MGSKQKGRRLDLDRLHGIVDAFGTLRIVVVGDLILDEYLWGRVDRISPEAPVPVVGVEGSHEALGGAGNVARNVVALGGDCTLCAVVGDDTAGRRVTDLVVEAMGSAAGVVVEPGRLTVHKSRVVARGQQMLRIDRDPSSSIGVATQKQLLAVTEQCASGASGAIFEDYGKGIFDPGLTPKLLDVFGASGAPVAVDPKSDLDLFRGAALVKPNAGEAERLSGVRVSVESDWHEVVRRLQSRLDGAEVALTRGRAGMTISGVEGPSVVPTHAQEVFDVQGAGDTTIAALWLARLAGAELAEAAVIANAAAGVVVGKLGTAAASRDELLAALPRSIEAARSGRGD